MTDFQAQDASRRSNASPLRSSPRRSDSPRRTDEVDEILSQARAQRMNPQPSSESTLVAAGGEA